MPVMSVFLAVRDFPCADCGQPAGSRCRVRAGNLSRSGREMMAGVHPAREQAQLARWREMKAEARA